MVRDYQYEAVVTCLEYSAEKIAEVMETNRKRDFIVTKGYLQDDEARKRVFSVSEIIGKTSSFFGFREELVYEPRVMINMGRYFGEPACAFNYSDSFSESEVEMLDEQGRKVKSISGLTYFLTPVGSFPEFRNLGFFERLFEMIV